MKGKRGGNKLPVTARWGSTEHHFYARIPKHVLFDCAMYLAALAAGHPDAIDHTGTLTRLHEEWEALHNNGIIKTKPQSLRRLSSRAVSAECAESSLKTLAARAALKAEEGK